MNEPVVANMEHPMVKDLPVAFLISKMTGGVDGGKKREHCTTTEYRGSQRHNGNYAQYK